MARNKHSFKKGQKVAYYKRTHQGVQVAHINGVVIAVSRKRVTILDEMFHKHYVKPSNLTTRIF